ncbi:MAG TPA: [protein-PII] uridylyltransferase [Polyangia bacterium]|nr:[protein-PII] uridylyltransferase [Polyangia bacterium]
MNVAKALPPLVGQARSQQAEACRAFLDAAHARLREAHFAGAPGDETAREWAYAADEVVRALFRAALAEQPDLPVALVAVGGYGRAELCPYSDLDLWLLVPTNDKRAQLLAEAILYPLWDLKLEVGHAVRTVDDAVKQAKGDLTAATSLLDARFLDGDEQIWADFLRAVPKLFERDVNDVIKKLAKEKSERHARFGETVYLLEPNVKNGQGGYRDLLVGLWAAKARYRVADLPELAGAGLASQRQAQALVLARRFFLEIRTAAHFAAKRKQDRLTFEIQEAIGPRLFPNPRPSSHEGVESAVEPSVEALMQQYFVHAKTVQRETDRILARCLVEPQKKPTIRPIDASFTLFNGKLALTEPDVFRRRPSDMLRIFNVALESGAEIYGHTQDLIVEQVAQGTLADDPAAGRELMKLIADDRDKRNPSLLEQAHDLGLLAAVMPEFAPCTGRVQHDLYHVFTVDQHQLYAVGRLKQLARGELAEEMPTVTQAMQDVKRRAPLYLGTLLHDVGKPLGKGHSETGARLAVAIATRLGLTAEDVSQTEFLVRKHLLLSHLSQRRDLNDVAMIANLAQELTDEETLRELYLLTVADMSMVAPGNMTEWKEQLLRELYTRTLGFYRRGPDLAGHGGVEEQAALVARRRKRVAELMGASEDELAGWFASLPDRYVTLTQPRQIARHVQLSRRREGPVAIEVVHRPRKAVSDFTVCADDAPGLLAKIAGVLVAHRVDVLQAQIHTRVVDGVVVEALDTFMTRDRYGRPITDPARWQRVEADLTRVLGGLATVAQVIDERREKSSLPERVVPQVRTEINVDNDVSADFSVVDVYTHDRLGVLHTITNTLAELELDIQLSKVSTEGSRVADVFYVREGHGGKLDSERVDELKLALAETLGHLQSRA